MGRFGFASWIGLLWLTSCGTDEAMSSPSKPDPGIEQSSEAGVDPCAALDAMLGVPGVSERLCALNQSSDSREQCLVCAAGLTAVQTLLPTLSCPTQLENCPLEDGALRECFEDVGRLMTEAMPGCTPGDVAPVEPMTLVLRVATSSCGPIIVTCPPLQDLLLGLLGPTL